MTAISRSDDQAEPADQKSPDAFRTISEVAEELGLAAHVLRFWESKFPQIKPLKRGGNRRYYRPADVRLLKALQVLLHGEGYTIRGAQQLLKEQGLKVTVAKALGEEPAGKVLTDAEQFPSATATAAKSVATEPEGSKPAVEETPAKSPAALKGLLAELKSLRTEMES